ncbi:MAG: glutamine--fructose-6-phosphate transaminase (isomerizing) [Flavobacteriales bacterium]|nr:glutamine--fructose-6-phosphate transaminase (isomerizing) [Flavobacteriales bacterium]MBT4102927.1 glutamine--fructose-6-phosphate transaminase (isomerizing) [Flavobacteriales bacterium]MBT4528716.1 glutamine--fructose-6-phosphate transaminase (isomerizing) [Flavobacteriales bacterium]MBT5024233.1 glutamine--fructose-6-phosphate transaminase (isomerizing) [Flavobacteriales bacterium]MBT7489850.1 glutamine--fructose-6-phosphate transaminase (isomerizing) [Flavobacteriales bacterium]
MCGIVGYLGDKQAGNILITGLQRLEYRGYDSAGIALNNGDLITHKAKGKVQDLIDMMGKVPESTIGIGHTRWATHGEPNDINAHPHLSQSGRLVMVHNGIIENYEALKSFLAGNGYQSVSDTDTEVLLNLIEFFQEREKVKLEKAVRLALNEVDGAYAIAVMDRDDPEKIVMARLGSPLVIGIGNNEFFIGSDATPFLDHTKRVVYLEDGEMAMVSRDGGLTIRKIESDERVSAEINQLQQEISSIEKGGYDHFMLKEIFEQPRSIHDTMRGRIDPKTGTVKMAGLKTIHDSLMDANRLILVGCGTSWHAAMVGEYLIEDLARVPVEVEYASEFRYRNPVLGPKDVVIAVSQSGETADTLAAIKMAKKAGATVFGICNVVGSSIARETNAGAFTHAGPEIGVASTKAFTAQVTVLTLMAIYLGQHRQTLSKTKAIQLVKALTKIPSLIDKMLVQDDTILKAAVSLNKADNALFLGRGLQFPVALEGALKLKEISYIHAEGYPSAEMKHGPIALITEKMPVIILAPKMDLYNKSLSNIQEVKARKGYVIAIVSEGDVDVTKHSDVVIEVPETERVLLPLLTTIPLQLLSYHVAVMRGCNVDQPRNLAKSVTVE